jgi:MGT family glycosyltransferase
MSKHVFFLAAPASGHVNPTLPLVTELIERGHRVTYATGPALVPSAAAAGAATITLPWTVDPGALSHDRFTTTTFIGLLSELFDAAAPAFDALVEGCRADGVNVVCFDATVAPIGATLAARLDVPAVSMIASMAVNEHLPLNELLPPDFTPDNAALAQYAGTLHAFSVEQGLATPLTPMAVPACPLTLVFVPPAFQIAADTFDASYRFVGPTIVPRSQQGDWTPPAGGGPVLLVSLGTAFNDRPDVFAACAAAFADTDWHVVMSIGRTDMAALGTLPPNVEVAPSVPQLAVLRHAHAFVSHAGMNSIMESLAHQVPLVTLPQVPEQSLNARRVRELGLGDLLDSVTLTAQGVREAVERVSAAESVRERLSWIAAEIDKAGGAPVAADAVLNV